MDRQVWVYVCGVWTETVTNWKGKRLLQEYHLVERTVNQATQVLNQESHTIGFYHKENSLIKNQETLIRPTPTLYPENPLNTKT